MSNKKEVERGNWGGQIEFFLSCVGYAVGLGNVWRFPYLCYRNGGGAFLIPYVIMLAFVGLPVFFMELAFGQFASLGPLAIWRVNPLFKGVGFASILMSVMVAIYYNVVICYALYYLLVSIISFDDNIPWATCDNDWNTNFCISKAFRKITNDMNETLKVNITLDAQGFSQSRLILSGAVGIESNQQIQNKFNKSCVTEKLAVVGLPFDNLTTDFLKGDNFTDCNFDGLFKTPSDEYFSNYVLRLNEVDNLGDIGQISPKLAVCLLLAWIIVFFSLAKGVKSSGKVIYFTATFPYLVLVILLIRGVTLEGHMKGIEFYIVPKFERLSDPRVWIDAAGQIFYSLGPAFGSLITMASYNKFRNNCYRDAILVAIINCSTSIFAGFVIFSVLGFMAELTGQDVEDVATDGPGLIFIAYPEGIARMPFPPIWSFLFFFMLILLGLSSQFAMVEAVISALADEFPGVLRRYKFYWVLFVCMSLFALGIPVVAHGGIWILTLMNDYSASYSLLFTCFCELAALMWVYGINKFCSDIELMLGFRPNIYWKVTWFALSPLIIIVSLVASLVKFGPSAYDKYTFENWVQGLGWMMVAIPLAALFIVAVIQIYRYGGISNATKSSDTWGPCDPENRTGRYAPVKSSKIPQDNKAYDIESDFQMTEKPRNGHVGEIHASVIEAEKNGHVVDINEETHKF